MEGEILLVQARLFSYEFMVMSGRFIIMDDQRQTQDDEDA